MDRELKLTTLDKFQAFVRKQGEEITGLAVPVVLSEQDQKNSPLKYTFGWSIEIGVSGHDHGAYCPSGAGVINCGNMQGAKEQAHSDAKNYISGQHSLFNDRLLGNLSSNVATNFTMGNTDLASAPHRYTGSDPCYSCHGRGEKTCGGCNGHGKTRCSYCSGSGRVDTQHYDSQAQRTIYSTKGCPTCYGSGSNTCSSCHGSGDVRCNVCSGGGYLYYSFTIDGEAKRRTRWSFENNDRHDWAESFINKRGLHIISSLTNIEEVDVQGGFDGCTFVYAMAATLSTLQFKATVDSGDTRLCFAGSNHLVHDAGGVYDPAVWSIGQQLGGGNQQTDKAVLGVPVIKSILESHETDEKVDLVEQNWVSKDIAKAVVDNYLVLVQQLKQASTQGMLGHMIKGLCKNGYLLIGVMLLAALLMPSFADGVGRRFNLGIYPSLVDDFFTGYYGLFGLPHWANYGFALAYVALISWAVNKLYWKRIGKLKNYSITLFIALTIPYVLILALTTLPQMFNTRYDVGQLIAGGTVFTGFYLLCWCLARPIKWYLKLTAAMVFSALLLGAEKLNASFELIKLTQGSLLNQFKFIMEPALSYVGSNVIELSIITIALTIVVVRRRLWLNTKSVVVDYDSPVLLKSMKMD